MEKLGNNVAAQIPFRSGTGNDKTGCRRNEQSWNLTYQTFTYSEECIGLQRLHGLHVPLHHADDKTAGDVNHHDDDGRNGITFYELGSTIHSTKEIRFMLDFLTAYFCFRIRYCPLIEVSINGHLLTRHCIQGKTCRYFSHTL